VLSPLLRSWDLLASKRPDKYVAISERVKSRIVSYYKQNVDAVLYPPVNTDFFSIQGDSSKHSPKDYFIIVSRLVAYKRVDIVIDACTRLGLTLIVIGSGYEKHQLKKRAGKNITFKENLSDNEIRTLLLGSKAFIYAGDEDFGIAAVEAQACGKPVIAYKNSGVSEIVSDGKTGMLFDEQTVESLIEALMKFKSEWYDSTLCIENAKRFSVERFKTEMKKYVETIYNRRYI
jgi:glycosyltransferase involved in cell wall biosynthesis